MKKAFALAACAVTVLLSLPSAAQVRFIPTPEPAPFSLAVAVDGILYVSGEVGTGPDGKLVPGFEAQARQTMDNIARTLEAERLTMDDVFKCTVYLADMSRWADFNVIYVPYFKPGRLPARSAVGASGLAMGAFMEVECWARIPKTAGK
jgi:2-iminobutanoate/2-iminopropanoate deaminase